MFAIVLTDIDFHFVCYLIWSFLGIVLDKTSSYTLKILGVTGDCPALRLVLNHIGHGGYYCCWYCYVKGEHINGKRQYKFEKSMMLRRSDVFLHESQLAEQDKTNIFGRLGISVLNQIVDIPLPRCIISDYLHVTLLGHGKALILNLYHSLSPSERATVDDCFNKQTFPHHFNRKMRPVSSFAFVKATEIRNMLLYGLLPILEPYLPLDRFAHLALYISFIRLLHDEKGVFGSETSNVALNLFTTFYRDHSKFYDGLQNYVLHLHMHLCTIYNDYGALSFIGCFGQEDLIGKISLNHHGTRFFGESITYFYNIDHAMYRNRMEPKQINDLIDNVHQLSIAHGELHDRIEDQSKNVPFKVVSKTRQLCQLFHRILFRSASASLRQHRVFFLIEECKTILCPRE
jgi:hypothetical protein